MEGAINGDTSRRAVARTAGMEWSPSPSGTVWRKRVHLVGPPESGQVTSVVRYEPGARFPAHDHPDGEEILVLDGVFSDEQGDWPSGTYLLNPEGFRHAPHSDPGCRLFVKLRQYAGRDRRHVALARTDFVWETVRVGDAAIERALLYEQPGHPDRMHLERWPAGAALGNVVHPGGVEIFVLRGTWSDDEGDYPEGAWLRLPPGAQHRPRSEAGCELYVKRGGVAALASSRRRAPSERAGPSPADSRT